MPRPTRMTFLGLAAVLLVAAILPAAASAVTLEELLAMTPGERKAAKADLTTAQKKQLHQEFRALAPAAQEATAKTLLPHRGATAKSREPRAVHTLSYDTGVAHGFRVASSKVVGNRFDTGFGNPHTLTSVTFQLAGNFSSSGFLSVFGAPVGSTAPLLASFSLSGVAIDTLVSMPLPGGPITGLSGDFLAGVLQSAQASSLGTIITTYVAVAVDINDAGAGFHGMSINQGGTGGFNAAPTVVTATGATPGVPFNAIVRMTGESLPVELMSFTVDQD